MSAVIAVVAAIAFDAAAGDRGIGALTVTLITRVGGADVVVVTVSIRKAAVR